MRKLITILLLCLTLPLAATKYYVTPRGNDDNTGADTTSAHAWKTWHYAFNHVTPGDTVYFRGGVYTDMYSTSRGAVIATTAVNGTHSNPTCFFAYPADWAAGNYPIFDCDNANSPGDYVYGIAISRASNLYFKGLTVRNVPQFNENLPSKGWILYAEGSLTQYAPNNIRFENCVGSYVQGSGFNKTVADTVYFINCDAHDNCDSLSVYDAGGAGTGFALSGRNDLSPTAEISYIYAHGCRAWNNSDQGFSITNAGRTVIDSCWSINNGYQDIGQKKGSGFKIWWFDERVKNDDVLQIEIRNTIIVDNKSWGINWTDHGDPSILETRAHIYNNFAYRNGQSHIGALPYAYGFQDALNSDTTGQYDHWYWNNLSYNNWGWAPPLAYKHYPGDELAGMHNQSNNMWDVSSTTITDADFVSLDTTGLCGARQANGALPVTTFGHLASTSECINAGIDVGLPYDGLYPDIGWAEYEQEAPPAAPLISTLTPYNITTSQARTGGYMLYDGGETITAKGICWGTDADPDLTDNVVVAGSGVADYIVTLRGLLSNTTYHVRAYATNGIGTTYGEDEDFTTTKSAIIKYGGKIVKR